MIRRDNRKLIALNCSDCQGSGAGGHADSYGRCRHCRGRGTVKLANPFYVAPGERPTWFQLGGGEGWAREVHRQLDLGEHRCWRTAQATEFRALCAMLEPWRIFSAVHCNHRAIAAIAPIVEAAYRSGGSLPRPGQFTATTGWNKAILGELVVAVRNRQHLWSLGRSAPRAKGARFDLAKIPGERLDALIQRHPNLDLVDQLRAERARRLAA